MKKELIALSIIISASCFAFAQRNPIPSEDSEMILIGGYDDEDLRAEENNSKYYKKDKKVSKETEKKIEKEAPKPVEIKNQNLKKEQENAQKEIAKENEVNQNKKEEDKNTIKKDIKILKGYKPYELSTFKILFPEECQIKKDDETSLTVSGDKNCKFEGKFGSFTTKTPMQDLIDAYKNKCAKNSKKDIYRKWIRTKTIEGYIAVCKDEKGSDIIMEANSEKHEISYQFIGKTRGKFTQKNKEEIYISFTSIFEK